MCDFSEKDRKEMSAHEPGMLFGWLSSYILKFLSNFFFVCVYLFVIGERTGWLRQKCLRLYQLSSDKTESHRAYTSSSVQDIPFLLLKLCFQVIVPDNHRFTAGKSKMPSFSKC